MQVWGTQGDEQILVEFTLEHQVACCCFRSLGDWDWSKQLCSLGMLGQSFALLCFAVRIVDIVLYQRRVRRNDSCTAINPFAGHYPSMGHLLRMLRFSSE